MTRANDTKLQMTVPLNFQQTAEWYALCRYFGVRKSPQVMALLLKDAEKEWGSKAQAPKQPVHKTLYVNVNPATLDRWRGVQAAIGLHSNPETLKFLIRDAVRRYGLLRGVPVALGKESE